MFSLKLKKTVCLVLAIFVVAGCQQKKNKKQSLRDGRGKRGSTMVNTGPASASRANMECGKYIVPGKFWGEITAYQGEQLFYQEVKNLTAPILNSLPQEDWLGFVSGQSGQYTGVRFWGNVNSYNGTVDPNTAEIRIEVYDDRACQPKADGSFRPVIPIHIGAGLQDFVSMEGYVNGGSARLTFVDTYGAIILDGQISNNYYSGTVSYTLNGIAPMPVVLGRFSIPAQGFFNFY